MDFNNYQNNINNLGNNFMNNNNPNDNGNSISNISYINNENNNYGNNANNNFQDNLFPEEVIHLSSIQRNRSEEQFSNMNLNLNSQTNDNHFNLSNQNNNLINTTDDNINTNNINDINYNNVNSLPNENNDEILDGPNFVTNEFVIDNSSSVNNIQRFLSTDSQLIDMREFNDELDNDELRDIQILQEVLHNKISFCFNIINDRRQKIFNEIESYREKLRKTNYNNNPQIINQTNKLQRIRFRAIEAETLGLEHLKKRINSLINEFKRAFTLYMQKKGEGISPLTNPALRFCDWIQNMPFNELTNTESLNEVSNISKSIMNSINMNNNNNNSNSSNSIINNVNDNINNNQIFKENNNFNTMNIPPMKRAPPIWLDNSNFIATITSQHHSSQNRIFPLHELPSEILHLVLDKLSSKSEIVNLLTVNKLWASIIVKILYYRPHVNNKKQLDLFLRTMKLSSDETIFNYRLLIKRLNFSFVADYIYDEFLYYFIGCYNLERLTLVFCKYISSKPVAAVLNGCNFLQSVDITGIGKVNDDIFLTLAESCKRVQGFYVPLASDVTFPALQTFTMNAPMLKRVKITSNNAVNDDLLEIIAKQCPMLVEVDITNSPNVTDDGLLYIFLNLLQLREIRVTHNSNISDNLFNTLVKNVYQLSALRLVDFSSCENITDRTIERLVDLSPKLRNIFLGKCSRITDVSLYNLSRLGKNLQTVHFGHCFNITDQGVRVLVQSCPRIQYVDFACCQNLTNRTLYELSDLTKLKRIGLVKCSNMTDEGLLNMISLRGRNDTLERVHLSYCSNLTIYPIYELLMACPRLSHLSLTAVPSFLRPDITAYCRPAPHDFSENQRQIFCVFSGKGVQKLRHYLMSLTTPTNGPHTDIGEILAKYIISNNLLEPNETIETGMQRLIDGLDQDSSAILAAIGFNQLPEFANDFNFQNIDFKRLDEVFDCFKNEFYNNFQISSEELRDLVSRIDEKYWEDLNNDSYQDEVNPIMVPNGTRDLNDEVCHVLANLRNLDERVDDFEVNVASLARIQFQFTGFLLHEMTQVYTTMIELNRQLNIIQNNVVESGNEKNIKGLYVWRVVFLDRFQQVLQKYKISTVVLRIYLKDNITLLTRQRELAIAYERDSAENNENTGDDQASGSVPFANNDNPSSSLGGNDIEPILIRRNNERSFTADQVRRLQYSLTNRVGLDLLANTEMRRAMDANNGSQTEERSETPVNDLEEE